MSAEVDKQRPEAELSKAWTAWVLTLFPEMFPGCLDHSLAGRALEKGIWDLETVDIRDFASDKHRSVDDTPFGGGPGMVMRPDILATAIEATRQRAAKDVPLIYLSPRGRRLDQARVRELAADDGVILLCGRFEGIDERVIEACDMEELSLGDFVLSGGEPAALALIDATVRLLPGVVGDPQSLAEDSFEQGLLEFPQYTRPQDWQGLEVPEALTSGHHGRIAEWRKAQAEDLTRKRRPDLWDQYLDDQKSAKNLTAKSRTPEQ